MIENLENHEVGIYIIVQHASEPPPAIVNGSFPVLVQGPDGTSFSVTEDGSVEGDPAAVERAIMAVSTANNLLQLGALALARLALRKVRPN